jgi:hypothetical protein
MTTKHQLLTTNWGKKKVYFCPKEKGLKNENSQKTRYKE